MPPQCRSLIFLHVKLLDQYHPPYNHFDTITDLSPRPPRPGSRLVLLAFLALLPTLLAPWLTCP